MCTEVLECSRRGSVYVFPLYNHTDGTQAHCLLVCPASKDCFGIRNLQPCGVGEWEKWAMGCSGVSSFGKGE